MDLRTQPLSFLLRLGLPLALTAALAAETVSWRPVGAAVVPAPSTRLASSSVGRRPASGALGVNGPASKRRIGAAEWTATEIAAGQQAASAAEPGLDPLRWLLRAPEGAEASYRGVVPGIDVSFTRKATPDGATVDATFTIAPGVAPGALALQFATADEVTLNDDGSVRATSGSSTFVLNPIRVRQVIGDERAVVAGGLVSSGERLAVWAGTYDADLPLIVEMTIGQVRAPIVATVPLRDTLSTDADADTKADPNDVLRYTATIRNTGDLAALGLQFRATLDPNTTLVPGSLNTSPIAFDQTLSTLEDAPLPIVLTGQDAESQPLTYTIVSFPTNGAITGTLPNISYTPAANYAGADQFTFRISDGSLESVEVATVALTVTSVNDAPAFNVQPAVTAQENAGAQTIAGFATAISPGPANEAAQTIVFEVTGNTNAALFAAAPEVSPAGTLTYTPAADTVGEATITLVARDNGGTANGGADTSAPRMFSITITKVNNAPTGADRTVTTAEDTPYTVVTGDFGFADAADTPANALTAVRIATLPAAGTLALSGSAVIAGQTIPAATIAGGSLTFTPAANANGAAYAAFTFQVQDDGGTAGGGVDLDPTPNTLTVAVTSVNDAPAGTNGAVGLIEDGTTTFTGANFGFTDPNDTPANALLAVRITTLPALGALTLSGNPVTAGQVVGAADLVNLQYAPVLNGNGAPYTTFTFQVQDNGGTAGGGVDLDASANTLTLNVTSVNDAPAGTNTTVSTPENTDKVLAAADFGFTDPNDAPPNALAAVTLTTLPAIGTLTLSGNPVVAGQSIPAADLAVGNLKFTPVAGQSASPYTTFTFQVQDDGGTAGGGVNLDASANTLTINVILVNSAPTGADGAVAASEDTERAFTAGDFGFGDAADTPPNALLAVTITTLPAVGSITLSGVPVLAGQSVAKADIDGGNLKFAPAANANGSPYTTFTFQVQDDGGTAGGGVDLDPTPNTLTVNVTAVNDAPAGTSGAVAVNEDATYTFGAADFGFTDPGDTPANALQAVTITTLPLTGALTLSGALVTAGQSIPAANIGGGNLKFDPEANASGSPYATFTFQVQDNGGTAGGGVDLDPSADTLTVNVTAINDAPAGADATVETVENTDHVFTAANFGFTDPNDTPANALLAVRITTLPAVGTLTLSGGAVAAGQTVTAADITAGNLRFTPVANASGAPYTTFTFQVQDDGGTANSGADLDASANTLTINVNVVNSAPVGTDTTIGFTEETQHTFAVADFGFTDPDDTPPNALLAVKIASLPAAGSLTLSGNAVSASQSVGVADITAGNLKFTPAANGFGTPYTAFTFQVQDDGGTANGGVDLDPSANTITINVTAINDAPAGTDNAVTTLEETQYTFTVADFGFTDPNDSPANALQSVVITTLPAAGSLTLSGAGFPAGTEIAAANLGNLKFTPAANASGTPYESFTFQVRDNGGTLNGGVDLDASPNVLTVNVTPVNDAPAGTNNTVGTPEDTLYNLTTANFGFTDPNDSPADALLAVRITTLPTAGILTLSGNPVVVGQSVAVADIGSQLQFAPAANTSGTPYATFTFQVQDDGGTANGGVDLDPTPNTMTINVTAVNDAPAGTDTTVVTDEDVQYTFTTANFGFTDPNDTPPNILQAVTITTLPAFGALTLSGTGITAGASVPVASITAGNLKFTPASQAFGAPYASFTFQVQDNGGIANGGVDVDPTPNTIAINVNPVNDPPVADNDLFDYIGNTELRVDLAASGTPHVLATTPVTPATLGVLDGDSDPVEGNNIAVTSLTVGTCTDTLPPFECADPAIGTVRLAATGAFSFEPAAGDAGGDPAGCTGAAGKETFQYTITDDGLPVNASATATVSLCRFARVWYVDPAGGGGSGVSISPFNSLASLSGAGGAGDSDVAGDYIYIYAGTLSPDVSLPLEGDQHLLGAGVALSLPFGLNGNASPTVLAPAGTRPTLNNTATDVVTVSVAIPTEIRGLTLQASGVVGNAIDLTTAATLTGTGTLTIADNVFNGAPNEGIDVNLNASTIGTLTLAITGNSWNVAVTHAGTAIDINRAAGTLNLNLTGNTNIVSSGTAVSIAGGAVANMNVTGFSGNTVHQNTVGTGIVISGVTFDSDLGTAGIQQVNGGTLSVGTSGDGVGGAGILMTGIQGNLTFSDLDVYSAGDALTATGTGSGLTLGVTPANPDGIGTSVLNSTAGAGVNITTAAVDLRLSGFSSTTSTTGLTLNTVSGQFRAPSGSTLSKTSGAGTAFSVASSSATVTYAGSMNVTSGGGVSLSSNTGTISFAGALTLSTGANPAFSATGGGTVTATDTSSTLTTSTATALNVNGTMIGAAGLKFRSITSTGGGSAGIVLTNTCGAGPAVCNTTPTAGGLQVVANGGSCTTAATCTGGAIQNKTVDGITLNNTRATSLDRMFINNNDGSGIFGDELTNFTLSNSQVTNNTDSATGAEASLRFNELLGTCSITNSTFSGSQEDEIRMTPASGTLTNLTMSGNTIGPNSGMAGNGITLYPTGTAIVTLTMTSGTIRNIKASGLASNGIGTSQRTINVSAVTFQDNNSGFHMLGSENADLTFNISTSTFVRHGVNPVQIVSGSTANNAAQWVGVVNGATIGDGSPNSGAIDLHGIASEFNGDVDAIYDITNNNVRNTDIDGIFTQARLDDDLDAEKGRLDLKLRDNSVSIPDDNSAFPFGSVYGTRVESRNTYTLCMDMFSNTSASVGGVERFRLRQRDASLFLLERLTDGDGTPNEVITNMMTVESHIVAQNDAGSTADATNQLGNTGFTETGDGGCRTSLMAGGRRGPRGFALPLFSVDDVVRTAGGAIDRMSDVVAAETLRATPVTISDLAPSQLAVAGGGRVTVDRDGAGSGWFVDPTPDRDEEFEAVEGSTELRAKPDGPAADRMDLLSVVMHEMGHVMGDRHAADAAAGQSMTAALPPGIRRLRRGTRPSLPLTARSLASVFGLSVALVMPAAEAQTPATPPQTPPAAPTAPPPAEQKAPEEQTKARAGETVSSSIPTLPAGRSVIVVFDARIAALPVTSTGLLQTQGTLTGTNITPRVTDDPDTPAANDPTITPLDCANIVIAPGTLLPVKAYDPISVQFTQTGGIGTATWSLAAGALPTGVTLNGAGLLSGRPTQLGTFVFTLRATDSNGCSGTAVVTLTITPRVYTLADGVTGSFFNTYLLLANTTTTEAPVRLDFFTNGGTQVTHTMTLAPQTRVTLNTSSVPGLDNTEFATRVTSLAGVPLAVERASYWPAASYDSGHAATAGDGPSQTWYFAEGSSEPIGPGAANVFDTYLLLGNPDPAAAATVTVRFLRFAGAAVTRVYTVSPTSRRTILASAVPELANQPFGMEITSTLPIMAARSQYVGTAYRAGESSEGSPTLSTTWLFADGSTGKVAGPDDLDFETFFQLANPGAIDATVTLTYRVTGGGTVSSSLVVPAGTRRTVHTDGSPAMAATTFTTEIQSSVPIVAERSMFWPAPSGIWRAAENSVGLPEPATRWALAEGNTNPALGFQTFIVLANMTGTAAEVDLTFLGLAGPIGGVPYHVTVPANGRRVVWVNAEVPAVAGEFGAHIVSANNVPIVVERSIYWTSSGPLFGEGSAAAGTIVR